LPDLPKGPVPTTEKPHKKGSFRHVTLRGLAVLLPSILTLWILYYAFVFVFENVAEPINAGLRSAIIEILPRVQDPADLPIWYQATDEQVAQFQANRTGQGGFISESAARRQIAAQNFEQLWRKNWALQATGLLVAVSLIYLSGTLVGGFLGRRVYGAIERLISKVPGFKQVYPYVKQLVDLVLGDKPMAFSRVVLVEFPRKGSWVMGFVTSGGLRTVAEHFGGNSITVFVPTTPTPFTGFTINVGPHELLDLPISIDEAIRYVITGGVLIPASQQSTLPAATAEAIELLAAGGRPAPNTAPTASST
jgi:uncharacterized membrane protein